MDASAENKDSLLAPSAQGPNRNEVFVFTEGKQVTFVPPAQLVGLPSREVPERIVVPLHRIPVLRSLVKSSLSQPLAADRGPVFKKGDTLIAINHSPAFSSPSHSARLLYFFVQKGDRSTPNPFLSVEKLDILEKYVDMSRMRASRRALQVSRAVSLRGKAAPGSDNTFYQVCLFSNSVPVAFQKGLCDMALEEKLHRPRAQSGATRPRADPNPKTSETPSVGENNGDVSSVNSSLKGDSDSGINDNSGISAGSSSKAKNEGSFEERNDTDKNGSEKTDTETDTETETSGNESEAKKKAVVPVSSIASKSESDQSITHTGVCRSGKEDVTATTKVATDEQCGQNKAISLQLDAPLSVNVQDDRQGLQSSPQKSSSTKDFKEGDTENNETPANRSTVVGDKSRGAGKRRRGGGGGRKGGKRGVSRASTTVNRGSAESEAVPTPESVDNSSSACRDAGAARTENSSSVCGKSVTPTPIKVPVSAVPQKVVFVENAAESSCLDGHAFVSPSSENTGRVTVKLVIPTVTPDEIEEINERNVTRRMAGKKKAPKKRTPKSCEPGGGGGCGGGNGENEASEVSVRKRKSSSTLFLERPSSERHVPQPNGEASQSGHKESRSVNNNPGPLPFRCCGFSEESRSVMNKNDQTASLSGQKSSSVNQGNCSLDAQPHSPSFTPSPPPIDPTFPLSPLKKRCRRACPVNARNTGTNNSQSETGRLATVVSNQRNDEKTVSSSSASSSSSSSSSSGSACGSTVSQGMLLCSPFTPSSCESSCSSGSEGSCSSPSSMSSSDESQVPLQRPPLLPWSVGHGERPFFTAPAAGSGPNGATTLSDLLQHLARQFPAAQRSAASGLAPVAILVPQGSNTPENMADISKRVQDVVRGMSMVSSPSLLYQMLSNYPSSFAQAQPSDTGLVPPPLSPLTPSPANSPLQHATEAQQPQQQCPPVPSQPPPLPPPIPLDKPNGESTDGALQVPLLQRPLFPFVPKTPLGELFNAGQRYLQELGKKLEEQQAMILDAISRLRPPPPPQQRQHQPENVPIQQVPQNIRVGSVPSVQLVMSPSIQEQQQQQQRQQQQFYGYDYPFPMQFFQGCVHPCAEGLFPVQSLYPEQVPQVVCAPVPDSILVQNDLGVIPQPPVSYPCDQVFFPPTTISEVQQQQSQPQQQQPPPPPPPNVNPFYSLSSSSSSSCFEY